MTIYDEVNNLSYELIDDFMGHVRMSNGNLRIRRDVFPDIVSANFTAEYVVLKDGTIRCSTGANHNVAAYDGCKESELIQIYNTWLAHF